VNLALQLAVMTLRSRGSVTYPQHARALDSFAELVALGLATFEVDGDMVTIYPVESTEEMN
jgi:hypothetical protein